VEASQQAWQPQGPIRYPTPPPATTFRTAPNLTIVPLFAARCEITVIAEGKDLHGVDAAEATCEVDPKILCFHGQWKGELLTSVWRTKQREVSENHRRLPSVLPLIRLGNGSSLSV
jgi:hypothetical protein